MPNKPSSRLRERRPEGRGSGDNRNGRSRKTAQGDGGAMEIAVPRGRNGSFEPKILPKHERRWVASTIRSCEPGHVPYRYSHSAIGPASSCLFYSNSFS